MTISFIFLITLVILAIFGWFKIYDLIHEYIKTHPKDSYYYNIELESYLGFILTDDELLRIGNEVKLKMEQSLSRVIEMREIQEQDNKNQVKEHVERITKRYNPTGDSEIDGGVDCEEEDL